jgi:hypothetical protein
MPPDAARDLPMETALLKAFAPIPADPYPWPFDGGFSPADTALVVIDMQTDFCGIGGYVDRMGYDLSMTRAPIAPIARYIGLRRRLLVIAWSLSRSRARPLEPFFSGIREWEGKA